MRNYFSKLGTQVPWRTSQSRGVTLALPLRYLSALFLLLTFAIGNVWADTQTYSFASSAELSNLTYTPGNASDTWNVCTAKTNNVTPRDGGFVQYKCAKSSTKATFVTTESFDNITNISFFIASSDKGKTQVKIEVSPNADFSSDVTEIVNASTGLAALGVSSPSNNTWYSISQDVATKSGYVRFTMTASSSGKYWSFDDIVITYTPSSGGGGEDPVCPGTLTISSKNDKTAFYTGDAIELTAALSAGNGTITYQWYKGGTAEGNKLTGKTTNKLQIASCTTADAGDYYCVASKSDCSDAVNADAFTITVTPSPCVTVTGAEQFVADYTINGAYAINSGCATNNGALKIDNGSDFIEIYAPAGKKISLIEMSLYAGADKKVGYGFGASAVVDNDLTPWDWATKDVTGSYADYEFEPISSGKAKYFRLYRKVTVDAVEYGSGTSTFINRICVTLENTAAYTITYNLNGGTGTTPTESDKEAGTIVTLASGIDGITAPSGQKFNGWLVKDATDATVAVTDGKFTMPASAVTITAQWADVYAVTYAKGDEGASGEMTDSNSPYVAGAEVTLLANAFTPPTGKEFDAWEVTETVSGNPVAVSAGKFTMPSAAVTVKATWKTACALDPTVSATTLGTTSYTTQVVNCAGISVLGSTGCTISEYGFVYGTATAPTISDNKKALEGEYTVAGTAFAETILSGLASNTKYYVRAFATNSHGTAYGEEISFTTLTPLGNVLVVANSADQTSDAITALRNSGFIVTVSTPNNSRDYTGYDLVVLDESLSGANGVAGKEEGDIKGVNIPLLNLKSFFYNSGRWGWGTGNNGTAANEIAKIPTTYKNAQSHPIFAGLTITDGNIDLIDPAKTGNTLQTATGLVAGKEGYVLATVAGNAFIHELTPAQRGVTDAKYLMVAISNNAKDNLSADGELLIVNAAKYLIGSTAWEPQYYTVSFEAHGDADPSPLTGKTITLPSAANGTASLLGWFTEETGGEKIGDAGESYTPTADITLHAQWEAVSTDARIKALSYTIGGGAPVDIYEADKNTFNISLPYAQAYDAITVAVTPNNNLATIKAGAELTVSSIPGAATFTIVAQSGAEENYTVNFAKGPKDGVCLVWADATGNNAMTVDAEKSLFDATAAASSTKNTSTYGGKTGYKLNSRPANMSVTLSEETFKAGDVVEVFVTSVVDNAGANDKMRVFTENDVTKMLVEGDADMVQGANRLVLPATTTNALYLVRGPQDAAYEMWNPYVAYIAVYRPMNPVLTAITINGETGTINESAKTVAVELQPGYDLADLTINTTIVSNTAEADVVKTVESNSGNWVIGDNTYRLTDKDGDYTEYTVTISEGEVKHTVSFNTYGGSTIDPVQVVDGQKLAAAPADPEKEDYIFQGWAEAEDGEIVDVTSFTITDDKEFHAVWVSDGAIKLLDGATVNHTNFITGVTADETVEFMGNTVNYAKFSGTVSGVSSVKDLTRVIAYNATTNKTKIRISAHNNSTSARTILVKGLVEGASAAEDLASIDLGNKEDVISDWIEFDNAANRTIYIMVSSSAGDVYFTQVKVIESGETPMKQFGEIGYSLNLNKGRFFGLAATKASPDLAFEGLNARLSGDYTALNSGYAKLMTVAETNPRLSFTLAAPALMTVTTNNSKTYYVTKGAAGTDNETALKGASEFNLTAGTWFITGGTDEVQITNIEFETPKCVTPVITAQPSSKVDFDPSDNLTATVTVETPSDGGTLSYQWYNAADNSEVTGATSKKLTTTEPGTYYVIITNSQEGYQDALIQSDNATLKYRRADDASLIELTYGGEAIELVDGVYDYRVVLPEDATVVPALSATPAMSAYGATATITDATAFEEFEAVSSVLVTAEDEITTQTYTVTFVVKHPYAAIENVTGNTAWDWKGTVNQLIDDVENKGTVIANYIDGDNFEKIEGQEGAYARRTQNDGVYQGNYLHFNTTVAGKVKFYFRAPSGGDVCTITVKNGSRTVVAGSRGNSFGWSDEVYVTGDVVVEIKNVKNDGTLGQGRIQQIIFTAVTPDYTRDLTEGRYGTICLPNGGIMVGAELFEIAYYGETTKKIFLDNVPSGEMVAGRPYIFYPNKGVSQLAVFYTDEANVGAGNHNGLFGFIGADAGEYFNIPAGEGNYILQNNLYREIQAGAQARILSNRAYINLGAISPTEPALAPGRRRISMGVQSEQVATGIGNVQGDEVQSTKVLINGQLFILRGEKMYDATGRLVK